MRSFLWYFLSRKDSIMKNITALQQQARNEPNSTDAAKKVTQKGILMTILVYMALALTMFHRADSGTIQEVISSTFKLNATSFSTYSSMYFWPYVIMQFPIGSLVDMLGVRKMLASALLVSALGTVIFAAGDSFAAICIGRAIIGIGVSAGMVSSIKITSSWFKETSVMTATAFGNLLSSSGNIIAQTPLAIAIGIFTWRFTFIVVAVYSIILAVVIFVFLKNTPEDCSLPSISELEGKAVRKKTADEKINIADILKAIFTNKYTWPLLILMPLEMGITNLLAIWGIPYLRDVFSYSTVEAASFTAYMTIGTLAGGFLLPMISDRIRSRKIPLIFQTCVCAITWFLFAFGHSLLAVKWVLITVMFMAGTANAMVGLLLALVREVNDPKFVGISIGATNTIGMSAAAVLPIIIGVLIDKYRLASLSGILLYRKVFLVPSVLAVIGIFICCVLKETHCQYICRSDRQTNI